MSITIFAIGVLVFLAHFLSFVFRRTNVPDVLILTLLGILFGPVLGWVLPLDFGKVGPIMATIALVVILFESGTSLRLEVMGRSLKPTLQLTFGCFVMTTLVVSGSALFALDMALFPALLLGVILAGTSSAVVIPMVDGLNLGERASTVLVLESALTDVLCIIGVVAMLNIITVGHIEPGKLVGGVLAALIFAMMLGVLGGMGWLMILGRIRGFPNTISSTIAYAFIVYGLAEILGFSGAIAAMSLGITLTNYEQMGLKRFRALRQDVEALTPTDLAFYREAVFLLKTYFFVYLGISIRFRELSLLLIALAMISVVLLLRALIVRFVFAGPEYTPRDAALTAGMAPKGLAAAVLAALPLQYQIDGAELIRDTTYMVVLISIVACAAIVTLFPISGVQRIYAGLTGKRRMPG